MLTWKQEGLTNLVNWKKRAEEKAKFQLRPGDPWPSNQTPPIGAASDIPTETASDTPSETAGNNDEEETPASPGGKEQSRAVELSNGAIAGVSVGAATFLVVAGVLIDYCGRRGGINIAFRNPEKDPGAGIGNNTASSKPVAGENPPRPPRTLSMENLRPVIGTSGRGHSLTRTGSPSVSTEMRVPPPMNSYRNLSLGQVSSPTVSSSRPHEFSY